MNIEKRLSPNFGYPRGNSGRNGHKIIAIVNHVGGGTAASNISWIMNPDSTASYNYYVKKDGGIIQFVEESNAAWSNGAVREPSWKHLKQGVNPNLYTVTIAREGHNHHEPTKAQYDAILYLNKMLSDKYDIPIDRDHIIGHYQIDSVNRWFCPGRGFPWDKLMKDLNAANNPDPVKNPGVGVNEYVVVSGDTLGAIAHRFGTTVEDLVRINNISNPNLIRPGQKLTIPNKDEPVLWEGEVKSNTLNVRRGPGTDNDIVRKLEKGDKVCVLEETGNEPFIWLRIGDREFVSNARGEYVSKVKETYKDAGRRVVATAPRVNFYDTPRWDRPSGQFTRGQGWTIIDHLPDTGGSGHYKVKNSRDQIFYITARKDLVEVR